MNETAQGTFNADIDQFLGALQSLEANLSALEAKFAGAGPEITNHLRGIDHAAAQAAGSLQQATTGGERMGLLGRVFNGAAGGALSLVHALAEVSHYAFLIPNNLNLLLPVFDRLGGRAGEMGRQLSNAFAAVAPGVKSGLAHVAMFENAIKAVTGRLGPF